MYDDLFWFFARELGGDESSWSLLDRDNGVLRWETYLETHCGIFLLRPPLHRECVYRRAPLNSVEFARTGGDGIHYSFLVLDGHWSELSPVVVTIPGICGGGPSNVVLAADLTEFLRLGIRTGYFALANLVNEDGTIIDPAGIADQEAEGFAEWVEPETEAALRQLAKRYGLKPLTGVAERLAKLQRRYQPMIRQPPPRERASTEDTSRERLLARFRPGDAVIWAKPVGGGFALPVRATVLAVTAKRVTIAAEDPDEMGAGVITRHVSPGSLQPMERGSMGPAPQRDVSEEDSPHRRPSSR